MGDTPKATKSRSRLSLSLNKRLTERLSSPQKRINNTENSHSREIFLDSNDGTPPHKKLNLDESYDSPTNFESNHSPTMFLSQTFCPDSPEVSWQWTQEIENRARMKKSSTLDSGITSSASSSKGVPALGRTRSQSYSNKDDAKTRAKLLQQQKAEKIRSEAILRERLSKLEDQLKIASSAKPTSPPSFEQKPVENFTKYKNPVVAAPLPPVTAESDTVDMENFSDFDNIFDDSLTLDTTLKIEQPAVKPAVNEWDAMDDFFNDSDADDLLLAATQQVESALPKIALPKATASMNANISRVQKNNTMTPKSTKDKRSSLYMKFLEDDEDDLFVSLDEQTVLKASQSQKARSPFQRYKSMPAATTSTSTTASNSTILSSSGAKMSEYPSWSFKNRVNSSQVGVNSNSNKAPIKRHASTHTIASATTNLHDHQLHKR